MSTPDRRWPHLSLSQPAPAPLSLLLGPTGLVVAHLGPSETLPSGQDCLAGPLLARSCPTSISPGPAWTFSGPKWTPASPSFGCRGRPGPDLGQYGTRLVHALDHNFC